MTPNQITVLRVAMAFAAVVLFGHSRWANLAALALTVRAIALDAVDGYLGRRKKLATPFGAQLDILGDRVIENLFFTNFAVCGQVSLWVPVLFFGRGMLTRFHPQPGVLERLAAIYRLDLGSSYAYGDAWNDRWMLERVGRPAAVNPSARLARLARRRGWPVLAWREAGSPQMHTGTEIGGRRGENDRANWSAGLAATELGATGGRRK